MYRALQIRKTRCGRKQNLVLQTAFACFQLRIIVQRLRSVVICNIPLHAGIHIHITHNTYTRNIWIHSRQLLMSKWVHNNHMCSNGPKKNRAIKYSMKHEWSSTRMLAVSFINHRFTGSEFTYDTLTYEMTYDTNKIVASNKPDHLSLLRNHCSDKRRQLFVIITWFSYV